MAAQATRCASSTKTWSYDCRQSIILLPETRDVTSRYSSVVRQPVTEPFLPELSESTAQQAAQENDMMNGDILPCYPYWSFSQEDIEYGSYQHARLGDTTRRATLLS
ncbi:hypothetical protein VTK73DRAFT_5003 [Phialemonium thermophilum]|uniref:Uncharacterized protein n=1 Tax=Phialemonium thermophilum TaxID=223376 RepID=A0ABR3V4D3_9PEZI